MERKRFSCLGYWLRVNWRDILWIFLANVLLLVFTSSYFSLVVDAFFACFFSEQFFHGEMGRREMELLLSLPFSRTEIWSTHLLTSAAYFALLALCACIGLSFRGSSVLMALFLVLLAHLLCAFVHRVPGVGAFIILLGFAFVAAALILNLVLHGLLDALERSRPFLVAFAAVDGLLLLADIALWLREGRRFVKGGCYD